MVKTQFNTKVQRVRSDNAQDFLNHHISIFFFNLKGYFVKVLAHTPINKMVSLNANTDTYLEVAYALKHQANILTHFWGNCMVMTTCLIN